MSEQRGSVALVGLPRTGKSTYLGSLWQVIQDVREPSIFEVDVSGDRAYLQSLGEQVALAQEIKRTDVESEEGLRVVVGFQGLGDMVLNVPDLSGETLRLLVEDRLWHPRLSEALASADAVLLFVHPNRLRLPIRINFTAEILAELLASADHAEDSESTPVVQPDAQGSAQPKFEPRMAATAAMLTDAIENIVAATEEKWPLRLGIVVSAWDAVDGDPTPREWLAEELPALVTLCDFYSDRLDVRTFGVSAQGGRLPQDRDELIGKGSVLDRCFARSEDGSPVPLSRPLEWALS